MTNSNKQVSTLSMEYKPYVKANQINVSVVTIVLVHIYLAFDFIKVLFYCIPNVLKSFGRLFSIKQKKKISGQLVLITGGGNGLGRELGLAFAKEGCNVAVVDIDFESATQTANDIKMCHVKSKAYKVDVSDCKAIKNLCKDIEKDLGPVDILVNNAAIMPKLFIKDGTDEEIERIVRVNFLSHVYGIRTFMPSMIERKRGHIIAICSISAIHTPPMSTMYSSTKFAVNGLMQSLAQDLRYDKQHKNIRLTTVYPYFINTRLDLMQAVKLRFPPLFPDCLARDIVNGVIKNETSIFVPNYFKFVLNIVQTFSNTNQNLIRDYVFKESDALHT